MSEHLSHDQISKWIMGQATPDEQRHGLECEQCSAELNRFRDRISTFRVAMHEWSEREVVPRLEREPVASSRYRTQPPALRWALLAMTFAVLVGIPIYQHESKPESTGPSTPSVADSQTQAAVNSPENIDDVMLMESVNAHLSRPIPMSMERVMALLPVEIEQPGSPGGFEGKESR